MRLRVGFTYNAKADYPLKPGDEPDKYAEFDSEATLSEIEKALSTTGHEIIRIGNAENLLKRVLAGERWDIVFNIAEGIKGRNRESQVPVILEMYNIPYTGSDGLTMGITLDKTVAKMICSYHNIATPKFMAVKTPSELDGFNLRFPVIVKPSQEGTSKGISPESKVSDISALEDRTKYLIEKYNQPVLIEEFIAGKEFTVAVIGNSPPEVLPPVQVSIAGKLELGDDFYHHGRVEDPSIKYYCPAKVSLLLQEKLKSLALRAYKALGCLDVGRIDIRTDENDEPYFLECNPLPNLGKIDVFPLIAEAIGTTYDDLIVRILNHALERYHIKG